MKKIYFLLFTILMTVASFGQTVVFDAAGGGAYPLPTWTDSNVAGSNAIDRGSYYLVEAGDPSDAITTAVYDLSPYASAEFSLRVATFGSGTANPAKIEISYDGGISFTQTEVSATPSSSTYIDGGTIALSSISNEVQIRISNDGTSGRGVRLRDLILTGFSSDPSVNIVSPTADFEFPSGTTSIDVVFETFNAPPGSTVNLNLVTNGVPNDLGAVTSPYTITNTNDGDSFEVLLQLNDSGGGLLAFAGRDFSVSYPCDLFLGNITTICNTETLGTDTYDVRIPFVGGNTSTYTIDTEGNGSVGGDNPSTTENGIIIISNVSEGVDFTVTFTGDVSNSSCNFTRNINSPTCLPAPTCPNPGDIIISEVMRNPFAVLDDDGEYFEVYNPTSGDIDMIGWIIKDDATASETHTISTSVVVPAGGYAVFAINGDSMANGGITGAYSYDGDISLGNSNPDGIIIECSGSVIDQVIFDGTFPPATSGVAMELASSFLTRNNLDNDSGTNWGLATATYGAGDLGTPGLANNFALSNEDFSRNQFSIFPNPTSTGSVTISSVNATPITVTVFDMLGKQVKNETISNNRLDVSNLKSGIYLLNITQDGATSTKKLVIR